MDEKTWLHAEDHVDRYKEDPLVAADKLAELWCENPTYGVDVWGCDWPCEEFFETFLDRCRENGKLKEALEIRWMVHNCPGPESEPCHSDHVDQQVKDYAKKHGVEVPEWLKDKGLDRFPRCKTEGCDNVIGWLGDLCWSCWKMRT